MAGDARRMPDELKISAGIGQVSDHPIEEFTVLDDAGVDHEFETRIRWFVSEPAIGVGN